MSEALNLLSSGALRATVGGKLVVEHYAGTTGGTDPAPCTADTRFQIASISKQFTAAAVLTLVRDGQLAVGDKVSHWFPHGPTGWDAITVHQLLTHTSGLGQWEDFPEIDVFSKTNDGHFLEAITRHPLLSTPGDRFSYSSPGYWLLAQIIEKAAQCPYPELLTRRRAGPGRSLTDTFVGFAWPALDCRIRPPQRCCSGAKLRARFHGQGCWRHLLHGQEPRTVEPLRRRSIARALMPGDDVHRLFRGRAKCGQLEQG